MSFYTMRCNKEQPGYYGDMLKELAKIDGVQTEKRIAYANIDNARNKARVKFTNMIFTIDGKEIYCIGCAMRDDVKTLIFSSFEMPVSEYTAGVSVKVNKSIKDYIAQPKPAGSYKHCEGGGWYSMANLYELNGKYYTSAY